MIVALGSDHGGLELKNAITQHLKQKGYDTLDCGTYDTNSCDYPDYAEAVCEVVLSDKASFGILICGTGIGMSMTANKIRGIRCARLSDVYSAKVTRAHNDANVMALGARVTGDCLAYEIVDAFLETDFSNVERHSKRVEKVMKQEKR